MIPNVFVVPYLHHVKTYDFTRMESISGNEIDLNLPKSPFNVTYDLTLLMFIGLSICPYVKLIP